jgi:beta-phosphoglucomutase-like phosphatase (HAD superfamily)
METAKLNLDALGIDPAVVPVVTRDQVKFAKPDPDLFLAAAERLGAKIEHSVVIGDAIWDMLAARRARALGVGLLSGGYGQEELERAGAARVYEDPADLLRHLDEIGTRRRRGDGEDFEPSGRARFLPPDGAKRSLRRVAWSRSNEWGTAETDA